MSSHTRSSRYLYYISIIQKKKKKGYCMLQYAKRQFKLFELHRFTMLNHRLVRYISNYSIVLKVTG